MSTFHPHNSTTISPSYITHQRRPALIPQDISLSPEDEQAVRMRTGFVVPFHDSGDASNDQQRQYTGLGGATERNVGERRKSCEREKKRKRGGSTGGDEDGDRFENENDGLRGRESRESGMNVDVDVAMQGVA